MIDEGIDTGDIISKKVLNIDLASYNSFRASIYPEIAIFVAEVLEKITKDPSIISNSTRQNEDIAKYREYIGENKILQLDKSLKAANGKGTSNR